MRHPSQLHSGDLAWPRVKILVFSADDALRFLARSTFRKLNVRDVLSTSIPEDAEHLVSYAPDIALVDFDGDPHAAMGFLTRLRSAPRNPNPDMPVLVLVKAADRAVVTAAYNVGIEGVVPKPVSGHELSLRVSETLKEPQRLPPPREAPPLRRPVAPAPAAAAPTAPAPAPEAKPAKIPLPARGLAPGSASPQPVKTPAPSTPPATVAAAKPKPVSPPQAAKPAPPRPAAPSPTVATAKPAVAGGRLDAGDVASVRRPAGGKLAADDLAPASRPTPKAEPLEPREQLAQAAPAQYKLEPKGDDEATHKRAEARHAAWEQELAKLGHKKRKGSDVAALDVTAIVAAHLAWLQTQGADGARANFQGLDLAGADLSRTVLANASFREVDLSDARLGEARLDGADFKYAKMGAADLSAANLGVAQLRHADMRLANLEGAVLRGADLSGARLKGARLAGADFKGATMISTDLSHADLSQAENVSQAQIDRTVCDMKTKLPPGISRPRRND